MIGRILIAEDDDTFRNFLKTIVEDEGHEVAVAENGITARTMLSDKQFDLVVSDLKMPGKNGLDLFRDFIVLALGHEHVRKPRLSRKPFDDLPQHAFFLDPPVHADTAPNKCAR